MVVYSHLFRWSTFILSGVSCDDVEIEIYQFLLKSASNFSTNVSISKNVKRHNAIWEPLEPRNYLTFAENSRLTISSPPSTCVISARNHPIFIINYLSSSQSSKLFFFIKKIDYTTHTSEKKSRAIAHSFCVDNYISRCCRSIFVLIPKIIQIIMALIMIIFYTCTYCFLPRGSALESHGKNCVSI